MNRMRLLLLAAALIAALLAAFLARGLLQSEPPPPVAAQQPVTTDVLVAAKDLAPGEKLAGYAVEWRAWPRDLLSGTMITKDAQPEALDRFKDSRARLPLVIGEPVTEAKVVHPGDRGFMSAVLPQGMRAISVAISDETAASGFILPNDRVDVILTPTSSRDSSARPDKILSSETVLSNVRVLAINQILNKGDDPALPGGKTAVLELTPKQAEVMARIDSLGRISLVLRSIAEGGDAGLGNAAPELAEAYAKPKRGEDNTLIIRYGMERTIRQNRWDW